MKTNFTRFRYVLAAVLCCLVSVSVWGQEIIYNETFGSPNSNTNITSYKGWETTGDATVIKNVTYSGTGKTSSSGICDLAESSKKGNVFISSSSTKFIINGLNTSNYNDLKLSFNMMPGAKAQINSDVEVSYSINGTTWIPLEYTMTTGSIAWQHISNIIGLPSSDNLQIQFAEIKSWTIRFDDITITGTKGSTTQVSVPTFSPESGTEFTGNLNVTLECATDGAAIRYTTDGTVPSPSSTLYSAPFSISETTTIKAIAVKNGLDNSEVAEATYTMAPPIIISTVFKETFDKYATQGGNDGKFNQGSGTYNDKENDNTGWSVTKGYGASQCVRIGTGSEQGSAISPALGIEGDANLTFRAAPWSGDATTLLLSIEGTGTLKMSSIEMINNSFTSFSINISGLTPDSKIKISGKTSSNSRFFLDDVIVAKVILPTDMSNYDAITLRGTWKSKDFSALNVPTNVTNIDMTGITVPADAPTLTPANPNCLIHVVNNTPESWKNVVSEDIALDINLQDGNNFYNSKAFEVADITYTRTFAKGWNTFSLPFDATITEGDIVEEFDSKTETSIKFKTATSIKANQAYLINIAEDNTLKTFTSADAVVPVTASTGEVFKSNFTKLTGTDAAGKYILVVQEGKEVFAPASENATVAAFRGYLDLSTQPSPAKKFTIEHDGGATNIDDANAESGMKIYSENGALVIYTSEIQNVQIYGLDGRMVRNIQLSEGNNTINGLAKGIYLINNQKAIVK